MLEQAVAIDAEHRTLHTKMASLHSLGDLALDQRDPAAATIWYHMALAICTEPDDDRSQAYCLAGLACVAKVEDDPESAAQLWPRAEEIELRIGMRVLTKERQRYERILAEPTCGDG